MRDMPRTGAADFLLAHKPHMTCIAMNASVISDVSDVSTNSSGDMWSIEDLNVSGDSWVDTPNAPVKKEVSSLALLSECLERNRIPSCGSSFASPTSSPRAGSVCDDFDALTNEDDAIADFMGGADILLMPGEHMTNQISFKPTLLASRQSEEVLISGYIEKLSRHFKLWRKRWAVLTPTSFCTFPEPGDVQEVPTECIRLREVSGVAVNGQSLVIRVQDRACELHFDDPSFAERWAELILAHFFECSAEIGA